ncbi:MAG TPA: MarR family transcriptional regulator [Geothrix sp.]|nr:MarR family transcriptional regulator [Geothrix sp.]
MFFLKDLPSRQTLEAYRDRFPAMDVDQVDAALRMLRKASLLMRELEAYFASKGLSQLRYLILVVLDRELDGDGLLASEVAERLDVSRPVMTRTLQALAGEGLLTLQTHDQDLRAKRVRLTKQGRAKLHQVLPGYYSLIREFMDRDPG